jgi:hypothetical protein
MRRGPLLAVSVAFLAGALAGHSLHPRPPARPSPYAVAERLRACGICLRVVPPATGEVYLGAYLTTTDKARAELASLPWSPGAAPRWRGTVFCRQAVPGCDLLERDPERLLVIGGLTFYGDPELLRQIAEGLR